MKTLKEIMNQDILKFPIVYTKNDFIGSLRDKFQQYNKYIESILDQNQNLTFNKEDINYSNKLSQNLIEVMEYYLNGNLSKAYDSFKTTMDDMDLKPITLKDRTQSLLPYKDFYRIRVSSQANLSRHDIFHVPLSERRRVASCRFSIPGLPALYLGTSAYICWEEMSRPTLEDVHISKFGIKENAAISLLNIALSSDLLLEYLEHYPEDQLDKSETYNRLLFTINIFLKYWPLYASCHIKVAQKDLNFKPEYIIPQILMQFIVNDQNLDGVLYMSSRIEAKRIDHSKCINMALPVKDQDNTSEYCRNLTEKIELTEPLCVRLYKTTIHKFWRGEGPKDFEIIEGLLSHYSKSDFGFIEQAVGHLQLGTLY